MRGICLRRRVIAAHTHGCFPLFSWSHISLRTPPPLYSKISAAAAAHRPTHGSIPFIEHQKQAGNGREWVPLRSSGRVLVGGDAAAAAAVGHKNTLPSVNRLPLIREKALCTQKLVSALVWPIYPQLCAKLIRWGHCGGWRAGPRCSAVVI